jgi:hypothetical protein
MDSPNTPKSQLRPVGLANFFATWAMQWQLLSEGSFSFLTISLLISAKDGLHHNHNCKASKQLSNSLPSFLQLYLSVLSGCSFVRLSLRPMNKTLALSRFLFITFNQILISTFAI